MVFLSLLTFNHCCCCPGHNCELVRDHHQDPGWPPICLLPDRRRPHLPIQSCGAGHAHDSRLPLPLRYGLHLPTMCSLTCLVLILGNGHAVYCPCHVLIVPCSTLPCPALPCPALPCLTLHHFALTTLCPALSKVNDNVLNALLQVVHVYICPVTSCIVLTQLHTSTLPCHGVELGQGRAVYWCVYTLIGQ